jgi:hypothetical protein
LPRELVDIEYDAAANAGAEHSRQVAIPLLDSLSREHLISALRLQCLRVELRSFGSALCLRDLSPELQFGFQEYVVLFLGLLLRHLLRLDRGIEQRPGVQFA